MLVVFATCLLIMALNTVSHYEVLRLLNDSLPKMRIPARTKLLVVIFATFMSHLAQMFTWGAALYLLAVYADVGALVGTVPVTLGNCIYFSAETYTSLGFGDVTPVGHLRMLVGVEALHGLLMIAWSASYTYLSMERFWSLGRGNAKA